MAIFILDLNGVFFFLNNFTGSDKDINPAPAIEAVFRNSLRDGGMIKFYSELNVDKDSFKEARSGPPTQRLWWLKEARIKMF